MVVDFETSGCHHESPENEGIKTRYAQSKFDSWGHHESPENEGIKTPLSKAFALRI